MRGHQSPNLPSPLYKDLESTENIRCRNFTVEYWILL